MRQELIDLLLGELGPTERSALEARLQAEPELRAELAELESLFGFMRRGEEIEADPEVHAHVMVEARRVVRPSWVQRLRMLPDLARFRFRHSRNFRIAAVSLGVHLLVMLVLLQFFVEPRRTPDLGPFEITRGRPDAPLADVRPSDSFVVRLSYARVARQQRLRQFGVDGQREAIRDGIEALVGRQSADGSFGDLDETGRAALVLLAEGTTSADDTKRGRALRSAMGVLRHRVLSGERSDEALMALVEDWALGYDGLTEEERVEYQRAIQGLLDGDRSAAARYWAAEAGFPVPGDFDFSVATVLASTRSGAGDVAALARLIAAVQEDGEPRSALEGWLAPLFEATRADAATGQTEALLRLQSPYRL